MSSSPATKKWLHKTSAASYSSIKKGCFKSSTQGDNLPSRRASGLHRQRYTRSVTRKACATKQSWKVRLIQCIAAGCEARLDKLWSMQGGCHRTSHNAPHYCSRQQSDRLCHTLRT
ncbi:uncharacterized protein [Dermacentor albipictus]|uniref:uncharacterized protein isoform X2 n=1 Tax=Dermacentor albipictus TaxID=60249 RepID=UPI0038FC057B